MVIFFFGHFCMFVLREVFLDMLSEKTGLKTFLPFQYLLQPYLLELYQEHILRMTVMLNCMRYLFNQKMT